MSDSEKEDRIADLCVTATGAREGAGAAGALAETGARAGNREPPQPPPSAKPKAVECLLRCPGPLADG